MSFRLISPRTVADEDRGVSIGFSSTFYDTGPDCLYLTYQDKTMSFDFLINPQFDGNDHPTQGGERIRKKEIGCAINEKKVQQGIKRALAGRPISEQAIDEIKRTILEGTFTFCTRDGAYLNSVPDYKVYYA